MKTFSGDYLLGEKVKIYQPTEGYRVSSDAVFLASLIGELQEKDTVLDVGSGTGAVSLCLAARFPKNRITGLEIQPDLVELAQKSAEENGFQNVSFLKTDIRNKNKSLKGGSFSHVLTNPPYFDNEHPSPNASKALANNMSDFSLEQWLHFCLKMLKSDGKLYLIHRAEALSDILCALKGRAGNIKLIELYAKTTQNAKRIMICAQKSSHAPLQILPPFYLHKENGGFTAEAERILRMGKTFFQKTNSD